MKKIISILLLSLFSLALPIQKGEAGTVSSDYINLGYRHQNAIHVINSISPDVDYVEFTDGSTWAVPGSDYYTVLDWRPGDAVLVMQNTWFFSFYYFTLQNITTGTNSLANLKLWPIRSNPNTHVIEAINYTTGQVILEDGSLWEISSSGSYIFDKWQAGDLVIIGSNTNHYYSSYKYILINTNSNLNEFVRARMY